MKKLIAVAGLTALVLGAIAHALPAETIAGDANRADGTQGTMRAGREGQLIQSDLTGRFFEATRLGQVFTVSTAPAGTTIVAANNTPVAAAAATILTLYNPPSSGKNLEVIRVYANWLSGTPAAGGLVYNAVCNQNISAAQNATPVSNFQFAQGSVAKGFTQTALTGGTTAMVLLRSLPNCTPFAGAVAATSVGINCMDEVEGAIVVQPGCALTVASAGTGTTAIVNAGITYREAKP